MMLRKLFILLYKDFLIILNDKAGMGYMFIMPVLLVFIMVTIQDTSFKSISQLKIKILIRNDDKDSIGNEIVRDLRESGYFIVNEANEFVNDESLIDNFAGNDFKVFIRIPDSTTFRLKEGIKQLIKYKIPPVDPFNTKDKSEIRVSFSPLLNLPSKVMILSLLRESGSRIKNHFFTQSISIYLPFFHFQDLPSDLITFSEITGKASDKQIIPNSTQHNVPAWTLFAMFFIVMSLAGNIIREREEGSFERLLHMPFPLYLYLVSKLLVYSSVCLLQMFLMLLMGIYVLPLAGLPGLIIGGKIVSILLIGGACSLAAVGFGLLVSSLTRTYQQATSFGAITVVILSAIGGVWVPVLAMPQFMQKISILSPLNWGIRSFHKVLVAGLSYHSCITEMLALLLFFAVCVTMAVWLFRRYSYIHL